MSARGRAAVRSARSSVTLELNIDEHGHVTGAQVVRKLHPALDEAAMQAARKTRFAPAMKDHSPVAAQLRFTFTFVLE